MVQKRSQKAVTATPTAASVLSVPLKAKWIAALRSGKFKQARGTLRDKRSYCCLGVLCKVADIPIDEDGMFPRGEHSYRKIWDLLGAEGGGRILASMNDGGKSFAAIADYIEANIPAVDHSVSEAS